MTIFVTNETENQDDFSYDEVARLVINGVLDYERFPYEAIVDVTLVNNDTIHEINRIQRGIDRPTDVLSFPMIEYPKAGDFSKIEEDMSNFDPDSGEAVLGDIIISLDKVFEQAKEYGHTRKREYAFLICHSMLHLLGYDHMVESEEAIMLAKQSAILEILGIVRDER